MYDSEGLAGARIRRMSAPDDEVIARAHKRIGTVLRGKYHLDRVLGVGGMATVYAATHRNGKEFAVKVLHPELGLRKDIRTRFVREGYVANSVKHAGAVAVLDDDVEEDGTAFLVMELLHGQTVETLWQRCGHRLPLKLVAGVAVQLLEVLAAAHEHGVIHRDIKPENLLVTREGQVKVLDFGIARVRDFAAGRATQTGFTMGTPAFMSPEHARAKPEDIDARTDLWAAGATIFTLASGETVHDAENAQALLILAATERARSLVEFLADAPEAIHRVVDRALEFDKADRWADAKAMRDALLAAGTECYGDAPTAASLAEQIRAAGAASIRPPALDGAEPRTLPGDSKGGAARAVHSPSLTGPTTAGPVATSPGLHSFSPGGVWGSRRKRLAFGGAAVALTVMLIGAIFARGTGSDPALAQGTAAAGGSLESSAPSTPPPGSNRRGARPRSGVVGRDALRGLARPEHVGARARPSADLPRPPHPPRRP